MQRSYQNKYFSILGDSISTLDGYSQPSDAVFYKGMNKLEADIYAPADTWWGMVIEQLGGQLLINDSFSGSMVTKRPGCIYPSYGCSDERTSALHTHLQKPDVIMVLMGINDWGCGAKVLADDARIENDVSVFSVAYQSMLHKLKCHYPLAEIWCMTLPSATCKKREPFSYPYEYAGVHIEKYCEVIRLAAKQQACRVIDLYAAAQPYDTIDGFHPNREGMITLADAILGQLNT